MGPTLAESAASTEWRDAIASRLAAVMDAARDAAAAVWTMRDRFTAQEKRPNDWVTDADRAADHLIRSVKNDRFPQDGWLSEESLVHSASGAFTWVVDPIDGTREFVEGLSEYAVSIGLVWQGHAVIGAVAHPPSGVVMAGAITTGRQPATTSSLPGARGAAAGLRILVSRSDLSRDRFAGWPDDVRLTPVGSIAYKLALVAYGEADAVVSVTGKNPWDVVGGFGLLRAAGIVPRFLDAREHPIPAVNERLPPFIVARDPSVETRLIGEARAHAARNSAARGARS